MTAAALAMGDATRLLAQDEPLPWRVFEVTTRVRVLKPSGATRVWLPTPLAVAPYQKTMGDTYHPGGGTAVMIETNSNDPDILGCSWDEGVEPALTLVSRVATTDYAVNLKVPPNTTAGRRLRISKKGLPKPGGGEGDLYAIVQIVNPTVLSEKEQALYQELAKESRFDPRGHFAREKSND